MLNRTSWQYLLYLAHWVRLLAWVLFSIFAIALLYFKNIALTLVRCHFRFLHHTTEAVLVSLRYRAELQGSVRYHQQPCHFTSFLKEKCHLRQDWNQNFNPNIKLSNCQVKRTYEATRATALAHHHLPSLGPIKCFGLLQTSVLRLLLAPLIITLVVRLFRYPIHPTFRFECSKLL